MRNCLFLRCSTFQCLEVGDICQDSDIDRKPSGEFFTNLLRLYYIFDISGTTNGHIFRDGKKAIIIYIASKVDFLQYQEHATHESIEQKRTKLYGTPCKIFSQELKNESTLPLFLRFN